METPGAKEQGNAEKWWHDIPAKAMKRSDVLAIIAILLSLFIVVGNRVGRVETRLGEDIDGVETRLGERIGGVETRLGEDIDGVETRLDQRIGKLETEVKGLSTNFNDQLEEVNKTLNTMNGALSVLIENFGLGPQPAEPAPVE